MAANIETLYNPEYLNNFPFISELFRQEDGTLPSLSDIYDSMMNEDNTRKTDSVDLMCQDPLNYFTFSKKLDPAVRTQGMAVLFEIGYRTKSMTDIAPHYDEIHAFTIMQGFFDMNEQLRDPDHLRRYDTAIRNILYKGIHCAWESEE